MAEVPATPALGNSTTTGPGCILSLKHVFGLNSDVTSNVRFLDESIFLYPAGNQIVIYNTEVKSQRFIHGTEAASPVSVSSSESGISAIAIAPKDRKYVAIAERGERASVSVFNVHTLRRTRALLVSSECGSKQFVSLCFSSDQRYLLTQGGAPDYTLINWLWEKSRPLQTIKLAIGVNVRITAASFMPSDSSIVVIVGSNLIRILRCESNDFRLVPLALKAKKESMEFQCMAWDGGRCLVGADNGEIFILEALEHRRTYCTPKEANSIHSIAVYTKGFVCGCDDGLVHIFERVDDKSSHSDALTNLDPRMELEKEWYRPYKSFRIGESVNRIINLDVSPSGETLVCSLENSQAFTLNLSQIDIFKTDDMNFELLAQEFHSSSVVALDVCTRKPLIATCSFDCSIRVWNYDENTSVIVKQFDEAPLSLAFHPSGLLLLVGFADRLTLMSVLMDGLKPFKDFAIKDCRECAFSNGGQYFAAASGTTIAVFTTYTVESVVNFRGHTGKIRSIAWNSDDSSLVSGGINGIVIEWDLTSGNRLQEFEQKNCTITGVAIAPDRHIYAIGNDSVLRELVQGSVKAAFDLNVVMTRLTLKSSGASRMLFLGGSTGSIRVFKLPLTNNFQSYSIHSGAVSSIKISPDETMLFAASEDGSISVLDIRDGRNGMALKREKRELPFAEEVLVSKVDLEQRVQLAKELNDKVEELTIHNEYQTKLKEMNFQEQIRALHDKYSNELKAEKQKLTLLEEEKEGLAIRYAQELRELKTRDEKTIQEFAIAQEKRLRAEKERYRELQASGSVQKQQRERELLQRKKANKQDLVEMDEEYDQQLEATRALAIKIEKEKLEIIEEFEETKGVVERDADQEIDELKESYDSKLAVERKQTLSLSGNNGVLKAKFAKMQSRIKKQKEQIEAMVEDERKLYEIIRGLEKDIEGYQKEITERGSTIADKDKRINDLRKKNQELEKFKFVLDYKIRELNRQIEPREKEIGRRKKQLEEMDSEIKRYRDEFGSLSLNVKELKLRLAGMANELQHQRDRNNQIQDSITAFHFSLQSIAENTIDRKKVKKMLVKMYQRYHNDKVETSASTTHDIHNEHERQRAYLEKMIKSLQRKHVKDVQIHKKANMRIMADNSELIAEINELRRDLNFCEKQLGRQPNDEHRKHLNQYEKQPGAQQAALSAMTAKSKGPRPAPIDDFTPRVAKTTI